MGNKVGVHIYSFLFPLSDIIDMANSTLKVSNAIKKLTVTKTRKLFFQLGVPLEKLDDIAEKYDDGDNQKDHFVQEWLDMFPDASWEKLVAGLREINMNSLAAEIESTHISTHTATSSSLTRTQAQLETTTTAGSVSATPAPVGPLPLETCPLSLSLGTASYEQKVAKVRIEHLEVEFSDIISDARRYLCERERGEQFFLSRFRDHLLNLPCRRKQIHFKLFVRNEEEILQSDTIKKLFIILGRHCNYTNYGLIFHIVKKFCNGMSKKMISYLDSLSFFEKTTTVKCISLCHFH